MGNRAVITTEDKNIGIYLHWNGGRESIETFLAYCDMKGIRPFEIDNYGWARFCQVVGNFLGGNLSIGIDRYNNLDTDNWDNGVYIVKDWKIIGREFQRYKDEKINSAKEMEENLLEINECQPKDEQINIKEIHSYSIKWEKDNMLKETKELLNSSEEYRKMQIEYMLKDKDDINKSKAIAMRDDDIIEINPFKKEINSIADWAYNFDEDIFRELQSNKEIAYMSFDTHYGIWTFIKDVTTEEIKNKNGMQKYLKYCKDNGITKETIEKQCNTKDVFDIMKYYKNDKKLER